MRTPLMMSVPSALVSMATVKKPAVIPDQSGWASQLLQRQINRSFWFRIGRKHRGSDSL